MKLYTEERVIETFSTGVLSLYKGYIKERLETLTPIELPSDEEILGAAMVGLDEGTVWDIEEWERGVKWLKEQILNQNK